VAGRAGNSILGRRNSICKGLEVRLRSTFAGWANSELTWAGKWTKVGGGGPGKAGGGSRPGEHGVSTLGGSGWGGAGGAPVGH
jgi:hypothetical protein